MDLSLGQRLLQQTQQGSIQLLEDAEHEQSLAKFWGQAPLLLLQQRPDNSKVLSELQCPLQAEGQVLKAVECPQQMPKSASTRQRSKA